MVLATIFESFRASVVFSVVRCVTLVHRHSKNPIVQQKKIRARKILTRQKYVVVHTAREKTKRDLTDQKPSGMEEIRMVVRRVDLC